MLDKKQTFLDLIICAPYSLGGFYREGSPVQFFLLFHNRFFDFFGILSFLIKCYLVGTG